MELEARYGGDPTYIASLPAKTSFLFSNRSTIASAVKRLGSHLLSPLKASPVVPFNNIAWSQKNAMFAAQTLLLAAASYGISSAPMEGFDEKRVCYGLEIPEEKYTIPLVISLGFPFESSEEEGEIKRSKVRYDLHDVCFSDKYGKSLIIDPERKS
jgi:nitroreductase